MTKALVNLCGWVVLWSASLLQAAPGPVDVKTTRPARGEIIRYATLPGTLRANQQATLYAKVAGYLKTIKVDKGDSVEAGNLLAEIEVPELAADLARHRAEMTVAEADAKRVFAAQNKAPDLVTAQAVDEARGRFEIARASLQRTQTLLNYARVTAPFTGIVTARFLDPGAFVPAATSSTGKSGALLEVADFRTIRAQVALPELEASLARVGQPVKVAVDGLPGKVFEGKVSRMSFALDESTRTMLVEADLANPDLALRPGMYATIKVGLEKHENALLIPVEALVMEKTAAFAWVANGNVAKKTAIKIGFNDGVRVEVTGGLNGDENIILPGKTLLTDGAAINPVEGK